MPSPNQPMLAAALDPQALRFPVYVSAKLDGWRCVVSRGRGMSRKWKAFPNRYFQHWVAMNAGMLEGLDGEVIVGPPTHPEAIRTTASGLGTAEGEPDFKFYVFDIVGRGRYEERLRALRSRKLPPRCRIVHQRLCRTWRALELAEQVAVEGGYEGVIVRSPYGLYKHGRSTVNEGYLLKWKRWADGEAVVVAVEELMHNRNTGHTDVQGHTSRSTAKAGQRPGGTLGALVCVGPHGARFNIGTGFSAADRDKLWAARDSLIGEIVSYKCQSHSEGVPRLPVFRTFRDPIDM